MKTRKLTLFAGLLLTGSCTTTVPTPGQVANADYGEVVSAQACQSLALAAIAARVGNPNAEITFDAPCSRNWVAAYPQAGYPIEYGYYLTGTVGTGNGPGSTPFYVLMRDGTAIRAGISEPPDQLLVWRP